MKNIFIFLLLAAPLALTLPVSGQAGTITYDQRIKIEIELPPEMESMRDRIPSESTSSRILYFSEYESLMKNAPQEKEEEDMVTERGNMMIRFGRSKGESETYQNLDEGTFTEKRDFMGRTFLISDEQPSYAWKLTGEHSEYLGFAVQKATALYDSTRIEAWFSPEIPVSAGPELFGGLPGMILVLSVDDGQMVFSATEINLDGLQEGAIRAPKKGKRVSRSEFDTIMEEKMAERQARYGGNRRGNHVFIMRH